MNAYNIPFADYMRILPELVLTVFGAFIMLAEAFYKGRQSRKPLGVIAFAGAMLAFAASVYQSRYMGTGFFGLIRVDHFSIFFHAVICVVSAFAILASLDWVRDRIDRLGEYYARILLGTVGMVLLSSPTDLAHMFVALDLSSIASYVLAGFRRRSASRAVSPLTDGSGWCGWSLP